LESLLIHLRYMNRLVVLVMMLVVLVNEVVMVAEAVTVS
jgi:hypothetical protein